MKRLLPAALVTVSCAGCVIVGPDYETPQVPVPQKFESSDAALTSAEPAIERWWKNFNDPILDDLIGQAVRENNDLQGAIARVNQARAIQNQAFLDLFPTITITDCP